MNENAFSFIPASALSKQNCKEQMKKVDYGEKRGESGRKGKKTNKNASKGKVVIKGVVEKRR